LADIIGQYTVGQFAVAVAGFVGVIAVIASQLG
jgi:hypothetical protein